MENEEKTRKDYLTPLIVLFAAILIAGAWLYPNPERQKSLLFKAEISALAEKILPASGVTLPVYWGNLGAEMVRAGVIDKEKLERLYASEGGLGAEEKELLEGENNGQLKITRGNARFILNMLWALGLGTKNDILEKGEMSDPQYGARLPDGQGAQKFASTGGWTLATGNPMEHYNRHPFVMLTLEQQVLVERVSKNIYRPCCNNSTHFPDCNHGMAMLGLLELMAAQNVTEEEMYKTALQVNSYWFPETYLAIAQYLALNGTEWENADPKEILGYQYSSAVGYGKILNQLKTPERKSGSSCGV